MRQRGRHGIRRKPLKEGRFERVLKETTKTYGKALKNLASDEKSIAPADADGRKRCAGNAFLDFDSCVVTEPKREENCC